MSSDPTDWGKDGVQHWLVTEGCSMPISVAMDSVHRRDRKQVCTTIERIVVERPDPTEVQPQGMGLTPGYDYDAGTPSSLNTQCSKYHANPCRSTHAQRCQSEIFRRTTSPECPVQVHTPNGDRQPQFIAFTGVDLRLHRCCRIDTQTQAIRNNHRRFRRWRQHHSDRRHMLVAHMLLQQFTNMPETEA